VSRRGDTIEEKGSICPTSNSLRSAALTDMEHAVSPAQLFPHGRWLVCKPVDYDVRYKINPWMDPSRVPDKVKAIVQWNNLHHHLLRLGAWLEYVQHEDGLPDMVFTANAGLVVGKTVVLSRFRYAERKGEERFFREWFEDRGYTVVTVKSGDFEGEGDALFAGDTLFCGYGFRSDLSVCNELQALVDVKKIVAVKLVDPRFYHIDTCFCPLTPKLAMIYPGAFSPEDVEKLGREIELIRVPENDALQFVCNAVVLGKNVVVPAGCQETYDLLSQRGYTSYPVELSEFIKAGGAAKCLSLRLDQKI
jgi:N-dimethylarginine dimethylaminohydrolase